MPAAAGIWGTTGAENVAPPVTEGPTASRPWLRLEFPSQIPCPACGAPPGVKIGSEAPSGFGVGPGHRPKGEGPSLLASYVVFSS